MRIERLKTGMVFIGYFFLFLSRYFFPLPKYLLRSLQNHFSQELSVKCSSHPQVKPLEVGNWGLHWDFRETPFLATEAIPAEALRCEDIWRHLVSQNSQNCGKRARQNRWGKEEGIHVRRGHFCAAESLVLPAKPTGTPPASIRGTWARGRRV